MKTLFKKLIDHFENINPILVKESRQIVRSKSLIFITITELIIFIIASVAVVSEYKTLQASTMRTNIGFGFFSIIIIGLFIAVSLIVFKTAWKTTKECDINSFDLLFLTTLTPQRYICGKNSTSLLLSTLIISIGLPFTSLCYIVGGISLPYILLFILFVYAYAFLLSSLTTFLATLPLIRAVKIFLLAILLLCIGNVCIGIWSILNFSRVGLFSMISLKNASCHYLLAFSTLFYFCVVKVLNSTSAFQITPSKTNRSIRVKKNILLSLLAVILFCCGGFFINNFYPIDSNIFTPCTILTMVFFISCNLLLLLIGISTPFVVNFRSNQRILTSSKKKNTLLKWLCFPFYEGTINAYSLCFSLIILCALFLFSVSMLNASLPEPFQLTAIASFDSSEQKFFLALPTISLIYSLFYCILALIGTKICHHFKFFVSPILVLFVLLVAIIIIDICICSCSSSLHFRPATFSSIIVVFNGLSRGEEFITFVVSWVIAILIFVFISLIIFVIKGQEAESIRKLEEQGDTVAKKDNEEKKINDKKATE